MKYDQITPNNIVEAVKLVNELHNNLNSRWAINFLLYGSVLRNGVGNDIDICVVHCFRDPSRIIKAVHDWMGVMGFLNFGLSTDTGALFRRTLNGGEQVVDIWFVYHDPGKVGKPVNMKTEQEQIMEEFKQKVFDLCATKSNEDLNQVIYEIQCLCTRN